MGLRVDGIVPVPIDLLEWVERQAETENIDPKDLVARCIERERRRLDPDAAPLDGRTRRPGATGAAGRMNAGEITTPDVAVITGIEERYLVRLAREGVVSVEGGGERGQPYRWRRDELASLVALGLVWRCSQALALLHAREVVDQVGRLPGLRGKFLMVSAGGLVRIVTGAALAEQIGALGMPVVVLDLGLVDTRLQEAA